jgi:NO-binding membrane sensor protein with MHYT domain
MKATASVAESSLLLWMLAALVLVMAVSASLGWVRQGMLRAGMHKRWVPAAIAAATLGTGICAAVVLALSAEALPFPIGYRLRDVPLLWLTAIVGCFPVMALLCNTHRWYASVGGGVVVAAVAAFVQVGWVNAVGFKPGINWRTDPVVFGASMMAIGVAVALWLAFSDRGQKGDRRQLWRLGAASLMGLTIMAGQEVLLANAGLLAQVGSVFRTEMPAPMLCLLLGVVVPLVLTMMLLDLRMRRSDQRRDKRRESRHTRRSHHHDSGTESTMFSTQSNDLDSTLASSYPPVRPASPTRTAPVVKASGPVPVQAPAQAPVQAPVQASSHAPVQPAPQPVAAPAAQAPVLAPAAGEPGAVLGPT